MINDSKIGVISLLKCYKDIGKIRIDNENKVFIHTEDEKIRLSAK